VFVQVIRCSEALTEPHQRQPGWPQWAHSGHPALQHLQRALVHALRDVVQVAVDLPDGPGKRPGPGCTCLAPTSPGHRLTTRPGLTGDRGGSAGTTGRLRLSKARNTPEIKIQNGGK
jgi:hypothetical protein